MDLINAVVAGALLILSATKEYSTTPVVLETMQIPALDGRLPIMNQGTRACCARKRVVCIFTQLLTSAASCHCCQMTKWQSMVRT